MITFAGFFFGAIMMAAGFMMVWKTHWFRNNLGDISELFGAFGLPWLSWKIAGILGLAIGFFVAFGIFETIIGLTIGRLFTFGGF